jgi:hypothetical protein
MAKLTALGGNRCAAITWVTAPGTPTAEAAHAPAGAQQSNASAARRNPSDLQVFKHIPLLK